ncbi:MAG TPA: hypothetical protein DHV14_13115 [Micrococcales bacterium]|nr:hypothetical protein [Micrococcales bacterium]
MSWELDEPQTTMLEFARKVIALRAKHPVFRRRRFFEGTYTESEGDRIQDIAWLTPAAEPMTGEEWNTWYAKALMVFLNGDAINEPDEWGEPIVDDSFLVLFNADPAPITFTLPPASYGQAWQGVLDSDHSFEDWQVFAAGTTVQVAGSSIVVFSRPSVTVTRRPGTSVSAGTTAQLARAAEAAPTASVSTAPTDPATAATPLAWWALEDGGLAVEPAWETDLIDVEPELEEDLRNSDGVADLRQADWLRAGDAVLLDLPYYASMRVDADGVSLLDRCWSVLVDGDAFVCSGSTETVRYGPDGAVEWTLPDDALGAEAGWAVPVLVTRHDAVDDDTYAMVGLDDGATLGEVDLDGDVSPALAGTPQDPLVVVGDRLLALAPDGARRWSAPLGDQWVSRVSVAGDRVAVVQWDLTAVFDLATGERVARLDLYDAIPVGDRLVLGRGTHSVSLVRLP